jgi:hypothetical protein
MSGDRAAARRPPDLLSITRGALNGHHRLRRALTVPAGATENLPEQGFVRKLQEVTDVQELATTSDHAGWLLSCADYKPWRYASNSS